MTHIWRVSTSACIACIASIFLCAGCELTSPPQDASCPVQRFLSVAHKYLVDIEDRRIPVESTCVTWVGRKTGLQPVEPYTCVHYWFPNCKSEPFIEAAIVVEEKDYESVVKLKQQLNGLAGQEVKSDLFPNCRIRFVRYDAVSRLGNKSARFGVRPLPGDIVCVLECIESELR